MVLFERPYGSIEFDESIPAVIGHFSGHMSSAQFREFLWCGVNIIGEKFRELNREIVWVANTKTHTVQPHEDTKWVSDVWNPEAYKNGVRHVGFIIPEKLFGVVAVENYAKNNYRRKKEVLEIMMFNELENAKNWYRKILQENYLNEQKQKRMH